MRIRLAYGSDSVELEVPARRVGVHLSMGPRTRTAPELDPTVSLDAKLDQGIAELEGPVAGLGHGRVALLLCDATREWPLNAGLPRLLDLLRGSAEIRIFVCTGSHDPGMDGNRRLLGRIESMIEGRVPRTSVTVHDIRTTPMSDVGVTERGTGVAVSEALLGCDAWLAVSDVKHHYFAGYSNPGKLVVPGLASWETLRGNHSLANDPRSQAGHHPWHPSAQRRGNPLAEDLVEALELASAGRPRLALALVGGSHPLWCGGGHDAEVASRAFGFVDRVGTLEAPRLRHWVISAGGEPYDESLYTAQRALELSRDVILPGSRVLFLARCAHGLGPEASRSNFVEPLMQPLEGIAAGPREDYVLYSHKAVRFAETLRRVESLHLRSGLASTDVRAMHMHPCEDPQSLVEAWMQEADPSERIGFVDDASRLLVRVADGGANGDSD